MRQRWCARRLAGMLPAPLALAGLVAVASPAAARSPAALPGLSVVPCSSSALVTAINRANSAGAATLLLAPGCSYVLASAATGDNGLPPVTGKIVILGGRGTQISRSPASFAAFRIIEVAAAGRLTLAAHSTRPARSSTSSLPWCSPATGWCPTAQKAPAAF
jgi:hypothetical protein